MAKVKILDFVNRQIELQEKQLSELIVYRDSLLAKKPLVKRVAKEKEVWDDGDVTFSITNLLDDEWIQESVLYIIMDAREPLSSATITAKVFVLYWDKMSDSDRSIARMKVVDTLTRKRDKRIGVKLVETNALTKVTAPIYYYKGSSS